MGRKRRVVWIVGLSILGVLVAGWLGLQAYLSSSSAKTFVASQLSEIIGLPVEVHSLDVGVGSSSLAFRIADPNAAQPYDVVQVESAQTDVSLTDLATGRASPSEVVLKGLALQLRVSKDDKILTTLPVTGDAKGKVGALPTVRLEGGSICIRQDGRPEFRLEGIQSTLTPNGDDLHLTGVVHDPKWGQWDLRGELHTKEGSGHVVLAATEIPLAREQLTSVPFVPESVWRYVDASGLCGVKITLSYSKEDHFTYEVLLTPRGANLHVAAMGIPLHKVSGTVRITGPRVEILGGTAELAGGPMQVTGNLNFGPEPSVLKFSVEARGVDVRKLPAHWNVPREFEGQLRGKAELELRIYADGRVETLGGGDGLIENARFLGQPAEIRLKLRSRGGQFQFHSDQPMSVHPPHGVKGPLLQPAAILLAYATLVQPTPPTAQETKEVSTISATLTLRDVDIAQVLEKLNVQVGYAITGKATLEAKVAVPVGDAGKSRAYRINGRLTAKRLTIEGHVIQNLDAAMLFTDGKLTLSKFTAEVPSQEDEADPGRIRGTANAALDPPGLVSAHLEHTRLPVRPIVQAVSGLSTDVGGRVSGRVAFEAPAVRLGDSAAWNINAVLGSEQLTLFGRKVHKAQFRLTAVQGTARLQDLSATVEGIPMSVGATLDLAAPYSFHASLKTRVQEASSLQKLLPVVTVTLRGRLAMDADLRGTLSPLKYEASGSVVASELTAGRNRAEKISVDWTLTRERIRLRALSANVFQGKISGTADIPLAPEAAGRLDLSFQDIDSVAVSTTFPVLPVRLTGRVSGQVTSIIPPTAGGKPREYSAALTLDAPRLTIQGIPAERLTGKVTVVGRDIEYKLEGHALGGTFDIIGKHPVERAPVDDSKEHGAVQLRGMDLGRLAGVIGRSSFAGLSGRFDLSFSYNSDFSAGTGRFLLRRLGWGEESLASELSGRLRLQAGQLETSEISGTLAGGSLRARGRLSFDGYRRDYIAITLSGADAGRLFGPLFDDPHTLRGGVSLTFRGWFGEGFHGTGLVYVPRGEVYGLEATEMRLPFAVTTGAFGYGKFVLRDAEGRISGGRVAGNLSYEWGYAAHVGGTLHFSNIRIGGLVRSLRDSSLIGNGRVSGRFDLSGTQVRSVHDLTGQLTARLSQTSVRELPVLRQTAQFLSPRIGAKAFEDGGIQGRLANGVFRIERFALVSPSAKFFASGAVTLAGRLDLSVVAMTGQLGWTGGSLGRLMSIVPAVGPVPLSAVTAASEFLSNRTIRLQVTGTFDHPAVRVNASALLAEEAVRFLVRTYTPINPSNPIGGTVGAAVGSSPFDRSR